MKLRPLSNEIKRFAKAIGYAEIKEEFKYGFYQFIHSDKTHWRNHCFKDLIISNLSLTENDIRKSLIRYITSYTPEVKRFNKLWDEMRFEYFYDENINLTTLKYRK